MFNKADMGDFNELYAVYKKSGFKTFVVSAKNNLGLQQLYKEISGSICAFSGNSGVGKSSILNALFPDLKLKTGEVSEKLGRGKHTTRHTQLFETENGFVVDTPGFSSIETNADLYSFKMSLADCFPDFFEYIVNCKFSTCTHTSEKGCAVIDAVNKGEIAKTRHKSYVTLLSELKNVTQWNNRIK